MKILVAGSTGLLGGRLLPSLREKGVKVIGHGMSKSADVSTDLSSSLAARNMLDEWLPDIVIHLVCLSNVDTCEKDPNQAYRLNVCCLENMIPWFLDHPMTRLVHISTDMVYDGPGIHAEECITLKNTYALTKYMSELVARRVNGVVLRTNFFGHSHTKGKVSFSDWLISSFQRQLPITLFTDVMFNPLSMEKLSEMIFLVAQSKVTGVYNIGSHGGMSKRDFAHRIASRLGLSLESAKDGVISDSHLRAVRPTGMLMDVTRFENTFKVSLPTLEEEIERAEL